MLRTILTLPAATAILATVSSAPAQTFESADVIDTAYLRQVVYDLASDSMMGRDTRRPEIVKAARYIEAEFHAAGLEPPPSGRMVRWWGAYHAVADEPIHGPNVIGWIEGSDQELSKEHVLFVAHFDHMPPNSFLRGDTILNGADDNASGTAGLLALAHAFGRLQPPTPRSLVFLAVSGEEMGMLGSEAYVESPEFPLEQLYAVINLDMIGRHDPFYGKDVFVAFPSESKYGPLAGDISAAHPELALDVKLQSGAWYLRESSDHWSFRDHTQEILFFNDGHSADLHQPQDEPDRIDYEKMERVTRLAFLLGLEIASEGKSRQTSNYMPSNTRLELAR